MRRITSDPNRVSKSEIVVRSGGLAYRVNSEWLKWPDEVRGNDCLCVNCDEEDNLYVATSSKEHPICVFSKDGRFIRSFGQGLFDRPHCLNRTKQGTFLVADSGNRLHTVQEITPEGKRVRVFGTEGVPSDSGYDVHAYEKMVAAGKFSKAEQDQYLINNTSFLFELDSVKRLAKPFNRPCCMAQAPSGEYFAADGYGNCAVHKFAADGRYLKSWGGVGDSDEAYRLPHWVNIDKYDRVWVSDREHGRCHVYDTEGKQLYLFEGFWRLASSCSDDRYVYFGELGGGIDVIDLETMEIVAQFGFPGLNLFACHSLCTDSQGNLIMSSIRGLRAIGNVLRFERI